ncbi:asparagine synthase (glutamine-hydrolyzing) [Pseudoalteromonas sp. 20-MNA-CIBAN-0454]|uniref:asparagine synthase (glutamine-hydrolyzing) n=1 Tax=Pseudoalteromonas sp. 20-MNA-CIBAN-0454 TaxID=3140424 RepID=UPI00332617B0
MCGISFYYSQKTKFTNKLINSLELTKHRGPDASGYYESQVCDAFIGLGHNRLSIIDLSDAGSQPMHDDLEVSLIFNGEIYNHHDLRAFLNEKGYIFKGNSDTEVILKLFIELGTKAFSMLEGMFSVVILDNKEKKLHIARDSIGVKPLYITQTEQGFFGSSEIKGLKPFIGEALVIDESDVYEFFNTGFLYEPATGYKNIKKLMPGNILTIDILTAEKTLCSFKALSDYNNNLSFKDKLEKAISNQLVSDVPLGVFFSGGADSSIIASMSGSSDLFFAEFASDSSSDVDKKYSKLIAEYLDKKMVTYQFSDDNLSAEDLIKQVKFVAENTEELISDYTFLATYQLSKASSDSGYKVMLSGMGGDEAFAGYPRYHVLSKHKTFKFLSPLLKLLLRFKLFPKYLDKKFSRLVSYSSEDNWGVAYSRLLGYFSRNELKQLFGEKEESYFKSYSNRLEKLMEGFIGDTRDKVKMGQYMDRFDFLPHNLMVSDKASMLASIELRVPLLDEALVAHGFGERSANLIDSKNTKKPLKELLKDCLPRYLIDRPKTGFNPPLDTLINNIGKERLKVELKGIEPFVSEDFGLLLIDAHFSKLENNSYKIWQLLYFKYWLAGLKS